ncbi:unnamed protein product, partial [Fusarium equiseti]
PPPLLESLSTFYNRDMNPDGTRKRSKYTSAEYASLELPHSPYTAWMALRSILGRPWFVRSWVIQETALSRRLPRIFCGTNELLWQNLVSATLWILDMCYDFTALSLSPEYIPALRSLKFFNELVTFGLPWDLTTLLNKAIQSAASEPRDRVYSLLALTNEFEENGNLPLALRAAYQKSVETIFRDVTRYIIATTKSLRILTLIRYTPDWDTYPSWVVDFSANAEWFRISYFSWDPHSEKGQCLMEMSNDAAGGQPAVVIDDFLPDHVLGLQGLQIDIIDETCGVMNGYDYWKFTESVWTAWKKAFQRLGTIGDAVDAERERDHIGDLIPAETEKGNDENPFSLHVDAAHERRLFFSRDLAYIGLGPKMLQKNDVICVLFGGATPFILRPSGSNYRLVGECYVFELMTGEAIQDWKSGKHTLHNFCIY